MYLFSTFRDPGDQGVYFALSPDGYSWTEVGGGQPCFRPPAPGHKTRDPFIARDSRLGFILLWTNGRIPNTFGFSHSQDLIKWSEPRAIPAFHDGTAPLNVWAPEAVFDPVDEMWTVFWSSTVAGSFPQTEGQVENGKNHRIFARRTSDWMTFSDTELFFDPGYPVIDASLHHYGDRWLMAFKDERVTPIRKHLLIAEAPRPQGSWTIVSGDLTAPWTEGPSFLDVHDGTLLFYDAYRSPDYGVSPNDSASVRNFQQHMGALRTNDFQRWENVTHLLSMPQGAKHGSFLEITSEEGERLKKQKG